MMSGSFRNPNSYYRRSSSLRSIQHIDVGGIQEGFLFDNIFHKNHSPRLEVCRFKRAHQYIVPTHYVYISRFAGLVTSIA